MDLFKGMRRALLGIGLAIGVSQMAVAQTGAGTYTGTYSGADHGTITVTIDQNGAVSCSLKSNAGNGTYTGRGGVTRPDPFIFGCSNQDFPYYLNLSGNGTPGGTLTGQFVSAASVNSQTMQGNFTVKASGGSGNTSQLSPQSISGLWYDPAFNGTGFNFLATDTSLIVTYYGRSSNGGLFWLISTEAPSGPFQANTEYTTTLGNTTAGSFSSPAYEMANWGQLKVKFSSCTSATATLSGRDGVQQLNLQRLGGVGGASGC